MRSLSSLRPATSPGFPRRLVALVLALLCSVSAFAIIDPALQMQTGNPSGAAIDPSNHSHYLIQRAQYAMDYNDTTHEPNWVAWDLTSGDVGGSGRSNFIVDAELPVGFYQVLTTDYSGSGYDRGHMCPSADRTVTTSDNQVVFTMSNMIPQAPDNNQGVWANFESYCRTLASAGNEILITSGPSGFAGSTIASGVAIPGYTWKIAVVVPLGAGTAIDRIVAAGGTGIRVIAVKIPNIAGVRSTPWENFVTSVAQIQADTGYTFFTALPGPIASAFRTVVDGSSAVGSPTITSQPANQTTVVGGSATFAVTATGDAPLSYQWLHDDVEIAGASNATLTIPSVTAGDVGSYYVVVTNGVGSTTSNAATLTVTGLPPVVTVPPASQTVTAGSSVTFAVTVTGSPTLVYQWRKNGTIISGATASTLTLTNVQTAANGSYDVVVSNSTSVVTSAAASLVVNDAAPTITTQPASRTAVTAENASFTVAATGTAPLAYHWRKEGVPLADGGAVSGTATATLLISGVTAANGGNYDVVATNALGTATSSLATLTVNPPPPSTIFWDFGTALAPTADPSSGLSAEITGGTLTQHNNSGTTALLTTVSPSTGTGASGAVNAGAATVNGALNTATSTYFEFTLTPAAGKRLLATGISFRSRSTATGPQALAIYSSVDGYAAALATTTNASGTNWALYTPAFATVTGLTATPITFRIYGYNGTGATGSTAVWRIDDLKLTVSTVFPPPVAPVVTATSPAAGATGVAVTDPITVTFNEAVSFTGSWFAITSATNGPLTASVSGGPTTFTLATPSVLPYNDTVTVTVVGAQVVDQASGTIHGAANTTFSFTTAAFVPPVPPTVTGQPSSLTVSAGSPATFTVTATGTAPLSYQWRKNGTAISGNSTAATATLTLAATTTADLGSYDCVVSNVAGSDVSHAAALTVNLVPPSVTTQPVAQMAAVGGSVSFTVTATGTGPLAYQWRRNGTPLNDGGVFAGTHTATLVLTGVTDAQTGSYDVVVTNAASSATSNAAALAVTSAAPGVIFWDFATAAPTSGIPAGVTGGTVTQGNNNGTTALLTTTSASTPTSTFSGGNNAGAAARIGALVKVGSGSTGSAYFEFTFTPDAGRQFAASALSFGTRSTGTGPQAYSVFSSVDGFAVPLAAGVIGNDSVWRVITTPFAGVTGAAGAPVTFRLYGYGGSGSPAAGTANWRIDDVKLTAGLLALPPVPPTITVPPAAQTATVGDTVTFTVAATGDAPFSYQWRKGGSAIAGNASATTSTLSLATIISADAGDYDCVVTNPVGTATSSVATLTVNKATAAVALGDLSATYDGTPHAATAAATPAGLAIVVTYDGSATLPVNAGSYAVVATIADADYAGSAAGTLTIAPASATIAFGGLGQVYDGAPKGATVTTTPAGLGVTLTYDGNATLPVNAGSYALAATIADPNYVGAATDTFVVFRANAPIALLGLSHTYDGTPKAVTATTTPSGLPVTLTYNGSSTAPTNAGTYAVAATVGTTNYIGSASGTLTIAPAVATITLGSLSQVYDGTSKGATIATTPAGLGVTLTYDGSATLPINAGSYALAATITDANYVGSASGTLVIARANTSVALVGLSQTYDGTPKSVTATTTPTGLPVTLTYNGSATAPTNAGTYPIAATVDTANYTGSASGTLTIAPASAMIALGSLSQVYDGSPKGAVATTTPAGLGVTLTYAGSATPPINAGSYALAATITDANYVGSASGTLVIARANAPIALVGLSRTYDGTPKSVTATTTPTGLSVTLTYNGSATAPTNAGTYAVAAAVDTANYTGSASGTLTIAVGSTTLVLGNLAQTYDGLPKPVTAATTPTGLAVSLTYAGSATAPSAPGSYAVVATVTDPNYAATASGTLVISAAVLVRHAPTLNSDIDGSIQVLLPESTTMNGGASISGDLLVPGTPAVKLNGHPLYGSTVDGTGATSPSNYTITLNGDALLRHVVRRTDAVAMPVVAAPPTPTGTRSVSLNSTSDSAGDFATLRNLTLNGNAGVRTIPTGTYGSLTVNGSSGIILGVAGATAPSVYNLQGLTLNGSSPLQIVGPVIINLASGVNVNGSIGTSAHPEWLAINLAAGGFTLNGNVNVYGSVVAPNGTVTINGNSLLQGGVIADRLTLNGNALLDTLP